MGVRCLKEKLSMILSMVIFGTIGIFVELIALPSGLIAAFRGITGALVILMVMLIKKHKPDFVNIKKKLWLLILSGVAIGFNWILLFEAYRHTGIPVATVGVNGAMNAAILACEMIALCDEGIAEKMAQYKAGLGEKIEKANKELAEVKYEYKC